MDEIRDELGNFLITLLNDEHGISEEAWNFLILLWPGFKYRSVVKSMDGRYYLPPNYIILFAQENGLFLMDLKHLIK